MPRPVGFKCSEETKARMREAHRRNAAEAIQHPICHPEREYSAKGLCKLCYSAAQVAKNPAARKAAVDRYNAKRLKPFVNRAATSCKNCNGQVPPSRNSRRIYCSAKCRESSWVKNNLDKAATKNHRRRTRKKNAGGSHTTEEWLAKVEALDNMCYYCKRMDVKLTRDHNIPLTMGGSNDIENILPACLPCNSRKGNQTAMEFMAGA
jgi:hypothetical protein